MDVLPQQNRPEQSGTGFTNLSQYIGANQNNQLGNAVGGGIQAAGQAATGAINQAGQAFQTGVGTEQNRLNTLGTGVTSALNNVNNGTGVTSSDTSNFQSALSGQGQGPTGLSNAANLTQQAQSAQAQGAATGTEMGRFGLLQNYVGKGQQYGLGAQTLDSAILGQTGQKQMGQARAATADLGGQANQAIAAANAQGQQLQNQAKTLQTNTQNQLGTAVTNYDTSMGAKLAADQAQQQAAIKALSGVNGNTALGLDQNTLNQLSAASGGVLNAGTNLYNVDLSPYVQANTLYANKQGVQSQADFAKAQALSQLAGTNGLAGTSQGSVLNSYLASPTSVGQYAANSPFQVTSNSGLNDALQSAASNYNNQLGTLNTQLYNTQNTGMGGSAVGAQLGVNQLNQIIQNLQNNPVDYTSNTNVQAAEGQANSPSGSPTNVPYLDQAQAALAANEAFQDKTRQQIGTLGQTFDINRILGLSPAATAPATVAQSGVLNGSPAIGNNGQPLTS